LQTGQSGKGLKSCFAWNYKATTKQKHKGNLLHLQTGQSGKGLKSCFAWNWQRHTPSKHTKGNLLHSKQGKAAKV